MRFVARPRVGLLTLAGPLAMLLIMITWGALIVVGCACLYYPALSTFVTMPGLDLSQHRTFLDALNVSIGTLVTLGGDMMPTSRAIRLGMGLEAIVGFALLTASVSWLLSVYPILEEERSFAQEAMSLYKARDGVHVDVMDLPEHQAQTLIHGLAVQLASVRNQMAQFPVTYYFNVGERKTALSVVMPFVAYLAEEATRDKRPGVRLAGAALQNAVDNFTEFVANNYLHMHTSDRHSILLALARDQMRNPIGLELLQDDKAGRHAQNTRKAS